MTLPLNYQLTAERIKILNLVCYDPTILRDYALWPNKFKAECVMTQHFVLRPINQVIYDQSLNYS